MILNELLPLIVFLALGTGAALGQYWRAREIRRNKKRIRLEARQILDDAKRTGQARVLDAELQVKQILLDEHRQFESDLEKRKEELMERERLLSQRLISLNQAETDFEERRQRFHEMSESLEDRSKFLESKELEINQKLEKIGQISRSEARTELLAAVESEVKIESERIAAEMLAIAESAAKVKAERVMLLACERLSRSSTTEQLSLSVPVESVEMKGRIIGRDGRNVRAFEAITGVDLLADEVPDRVIISSHDPERRERARLTLMELMADGRIQPARIEKVYQEVTANFEAKLLEIGKLAVQTAGVVPASDDVNRVLGKLKFRLSQSQNVLEHLIESAQLAGMLGAEIGLSVQLQSEVRRAALLHDIGKALPEAYGQSHALAGAEFLKRQGESPEIVNAVAAHHTEVPDESVLAPLVRIVDALSGSRPGARREDVSAYLKRLSELESIAAEFSGVTKAFALQAGRELHVLVSSAEVADDQVQTLAGEIATRIQRQLRAGGIVRVTVLRETKATAEATWQ